MISQDLAINERANTVHVLGEVNDFGLAVAAYEL